MLPCLNGCSDLDPDSAYVTKKRYLSKIVSLCSSVLTVSIDEKRTGRIRLAVKTTMNRSQGSSKVKDRCPSPDVTPNNVGTQSDEQQNYQISLPQ